MKNLTIKILLVCLFSVTIVTTVHAGILSNSGEDIYKEKGPNGKDMVYMAVNLGRIVGNLVFTMDDDFSVINPMNKLKTVGTSQSRFSNSGNLAIGFVIIVLTLLILNIVLGGRIVAFLKSKGRKVLRKPELTRGD